MTGTDGRPAATRVDSRARRPPPPEIVELRKLRDAHPELASAIDMQLALVELQRRVQARVPIPTRRIDDAVLRGQAAEGRPLLHFQDLPLDWTEARRMVRSTVEILQHAGSLDAGTAETLQALAREPDRFPREVERWYRAAADRGAPAALADAEALPEEAAGVLDQVLTLAMRPFLARCAETVLSPLDLTPWTWPHCPLCGGEPELAAITPAADRLLMCSRCTGAWPFDPMQCPFCGNRDSLRITSFASRDGQYRLTGCDVCLRYLKAFDGRRSARGAILALDTIATLPLDAAAVQRGYQG